MGNKDKFNCINFDIVINDHFFNLLTKKVSSNIDNKEVLSFTNDFEDGKWRYDKFQDFIWNNIAETALSHEDRIIFKDSPRSLLVNAAKNLRLVNEANQGSELAEILLYGIMKYHYNALPVVPKIFYKQNINDFAKGADSVHITIENDDFSLWFGEAKFYKSIDNSRLSDVIKSVKNALNTDKLKKENSIVTKLNDLNILIESENLKNKIKKALSDENSIDRIKPKLNIPILLLHECEITKNCSSYTEEFINQIREYHCDRAKAYFSKQIEELEKEVCLYSAIRFHLILFGVPSKKKVVEKFISNAKHYRDK